jgi:hypothetical protein
MARRQWRTCRLDRYFLANPPWFLVMSLLAGSLTSAVRHSLQACGIPAMDVKKLRDAGLCTVESVAYMTKRDLVKIKGLSDVKVDKIVEAGQLSFCCCIVMRI